MPTTKKLSDLYVTFKDLEFSDPADPDNPIRVRLRKLSPIEQEKAVRKANAVRVRYTNAKHKGIEDDLYASILGEVKSYDGGEFVLEYLVAEKIGLEKTKIEEELSHQEEWEKDDRLQNALDAWEDIKLEWAKGPDYRTPEMNEIWQVLSDFNEACTARIEVRREGIRKQLMRESEDKRMDLMVRSMLERDAVGAWIQEFRTQQILMGSIDPKTTRPYFSNAAEVESLPKVILDKFYEAIDALTISGDDLKG
jgi:hypothetical protein